MVDKKSIEFLPQTFRTNTNKRFLNATVDQLIQEPKMSRVYGYVGKQDLSPTYQTSDAYVQENDAYSQYYQLEPGLVINKRIPGSENFRKTNVYNYIDILNAITAEGGITNDHSRLFKQEYYNYEGFVDLDKLINYGKYYWLPNGPTTLEVNGGSLDFVKTFTVSRPLNDDLVSSTRINRNIGTVGYTIDAFGNHTNPTVTLVRGGTYTFTVSQPGHPFYIQTQTGLDTGSSFQDNILRRQVFGVSNNGAEVGNIIFTVPTKTAQSYFEDLPVFETVDLVTNLSFNKLQNANYQSFMLENNIDGLKAFTTKTIIFNNNQDDDWFSPDNYEDPLIPYDATLYDRGLIVPKDKRKGIWQISNVDGTIKLQYVKDWPTDTKIFVSEGREYGHIYIFKDYQLEILKQPNLTASSDVLYYQDGIDANVYGEIRLVEPDPESVLNVDNILGQQFYTSPNGVNFTTGLKIKFTGIVTPESYSYKEYTVEGVGKSIQLIPWENLITPDPNNPNLGDGYAAPTEPFDSLNFDYSLNAPIFKDYIVINRASQDGNAWSRTNRWFHEDIIRYSNTFKNPLAAVVLDNNSRGIRPIIEFDANLKLFNYGEKYVGSVTVIDNYITDVANQVEGRSPYVLVYPNRGKTLTKKINKTANINTKVLSFDLVADLSVDMRILGTNIQPNTVIESIDYIEKVIYINKALINDSLSGSEFTFNGEYVSDDVPLEDGTRVIFIKEKYENVRNKIYQVTNILPHSGLPTTRTTVSFGNKDSLTIVLNSVDDLYINMKIVGAGIAENTVIMSIDTDNNIITVNNGFSDDISVGTVVQLSNTVQQIHLSPLHEMSQNENVVAVSGITRQNAVYWWNNNKWQLAQQKFSLNQSPLFDVFNIDLISWSNTDYYPSSSFQGSKLFGYKQGSGTRDTELGFALSYKNIGNIGDIEFENYYDTDTFSFTYENKDSSLEVNKGFAIEISSDGYKLKNNWTKIADFSKQFIEKKYQASLNKKNNWIIDVEFINSFNEKNIFVFVNGKEIDRSNFSLYSSNNKSELVFNNDLNENDTLIVRLVGKPENSAELYTMPVNLVDNSANETFKTLTLGQIRNHLQTIGNNSLLFLGEASGSNNFRDIDYKIIPGRILQHSAGADIAALMFTNETTNIIKAINFSRRSYSRFKDRFLYLVSSLEFPNPTDARECLDIVLNEITINASSEQSFYYTDMISGGINNYIQNDYSVVDTNYRKFNLIEPYDTTEPQYRAVLVYLNNQQLLLGIDYTIHDSAVFLEADINLNIDDVISIYEYNDTKGCMVPATPTKLGLYPKFTPEIYLDNTYIGNSLYVIQGHDGSKTLAFSQTSSLEDYRDHIIIELEKRIYNNINLQYKNDPASSFSSVEPGKFRQTDYSIDEWTQLLSGTFLAWAGTNNVNVFLNNNTTQNDSFSFNYARGFDKIDNEPLPGYWRGIFKYFYDTDRPHTHPWEMLGITEKPTWWELRYGPAPYTRGNSILWNDLSLGLVYQHGNDSYIDSRYARPDLMEIIPVDEHGELLSPLSLIATNWNQQTAGSSWRFGDQSPQETAWRRSSEYPFAVQIAWALARPAQYCALSLNRKDLVRLNGLDQIVDRSTSNRRLSLKITSENLSVPGSNIWIRDRLADLSLDITDNFENIFTYHSLNLVYKTGGYTDKQYLQIIAEQASPNSTNTGVLIPQENYELVLTKSTPVGIAVYSAVIVEKTSSGFALRGFDNEKPYFTIIPRVYNNNFYQLKVSDSAAVIYKDDANTIQTIPYGTILSNRQQVVDFLISYGKYLTSQGFEFIDTTSIDTIPTVADWTLAVKEFLFWLEQNWDVYTVISLTPAGTKINFDSKFGFVDELTNTFNGSRVINSDNKILQSKDYTTYREGTSFELVVKDNAKGLHLVDIVVVQYEHTLVFDNVTVFNDVIYQPNLGNRQNRMKLTGFKTRDWNGSLSAPGFMINYLPIENWMPMHDYFKGDIVKHKNVYFTAKQFIPGATKFENKGWYEIDGTLFSRQLIPNAAFNAQQFENFYDVDTFDVNRDADIKGRNSSGFVPRDYFNNMGLDNISQHKFYLGMIREKGTQAAVNAFMRAKLPYLSNEIEITEQWAIRLGGYGGIDQKIDLELSLENIKSFNGSYLIELLDKNDRRDLRWNTFKESDLLIKPSVFQKDVFSKTQSYPSLVPNTGYAIMSDVDVTVFDIQKIYAINQLAPVFGEGNRIWVASDKKNDWNVYRVTADENINIINATVVYNEIEFTTDIAHKLRVNDNVMLKNCTTTTTNKDLSGFYRVISKTEKTFKVPIYPNAISATGPLNGKLFKLKSIRYATRSQFAYGTPGRGWNSFDQVYVDGIDNNWQVLVNKPSWSVSQTLTPVFSMESDLFGSDIDVKSSQDIMVVGAPIKDTSGYVYVYRQTGDNTWNIIEGIKPDDSYARKFGKSIKYNDLDLVVIGAPETELPESAPVDVVGQGIAYVMTTTSNQIEILQAIYHGSTEADNNFTSVANFGFSVAASKNGKWLAIGAPGDNTVYVYQYTEVDEVIANREGGEGSTSFEFPLAAINKGLIETDISVKLNSKLQIPYIDYYVTDNRYVNFYTAPTAGDPIQIIYRSWYKLVTTITNDENSGSFGYSLSFTTDGTQLVIGAPELDIDLNGTIYNRMGAAYVYERGVETFVCNGSTDTFELTNEPIYSTVYLNGIELIEDVDYTFDSNSITLSSKPTADSLLTVETNVFDLLDRKQNFTYQTDMKFGSRVLICSNSCSIFVGAPGFNQKAYSNGAVYRYVNTGRLYGTVVSQVNNATFTAGSKFRINGVLVTFTGTTIGSAITDINSANIPGVSATSVNRTNLLIKSDSAIAYNKLIINSVPGETTLTDLKIGIFDFYQVLYANSDQTTTDFGHSFALSSDAKKLLVGASLATNRKELTFDRGRTSFDIKTTRIISLYYRSGNAYLYEYQADPNETSIEHGNFTFAQTFTNKSLITNDYFGTGLAISKNWMFITALNSRNYAGAIYSYYNKTGSANWQVLREKPLDVDSRKIERIYLYNDETKTLVADLPVIDPEHGLPVPSAAEQIKYTVNYDPAIYSNTPNTFSFALDDRNAWASEHVGDLWWDTNQVKYINWNQGDLLSKFSNWGMAFPNSYISVYEWIESDFTPSQFATRNPTTPPLYRVSDVYTTRNKIDPNTLQSSTKYYFWIKNNNLNTSQKRRDSALALQTLISNPRNINIPFAAVVASNAVALFNCKDIVNNDVKLHIEIKKDLNANIIHEEWSMFDDGSDLGVSQTFLDRVVDSLAGEDAQGRTVPDINLTEKQRYGLGVRPRQTTFKDRFAAREIWVNNVNEALSKYPIALIRDLQNLSKYDPEPVVDYRRRSDEYYDEKGISIYFVVDVDSDLLYVNNIFYNFRDSNGAGDRVLVKNDSVTNGWTIREHVIDPADSNKTIWEIVACQTYDLRNYWDYADWYAKDYNVNVQITSIVNYEYEIANLNSVVGDVIKVKNSNDGNWKLVLVNENDLELIAQQNATIQLNSKLYSNSIAGYGVDSTSFEVISFAKDAALEFRQIFNLINDEILIKELRKEYKAVIKTIIDTISTQFVQNDWLLKTSLLNVNHRVRSLDQIPVYIKQPENIISGFIEEVKPYHSKIKKYVSSYDKIDLAGLDITDFDLPPYYNASINKYREPQFGNVVDDVAINNLVYKPWIENHTYGIEYIDVFNAGENYNNSTTVTVVGDGQDASAEIFVRSGGIYDIVVTNPGYGYTYADIHIVGIGSGATAYAKLGNSTVRTIESIIKFDRFTYSQTIKEWKTNTTFYLTDLILHNQTLYRLGVDVLASSNEITSITTGNTFSDTNLIKVLIRHWEPNTAYTKNTIIVNDYVPYVALTDFTSSRYFEYNKNFSVTNSVDWRANTFYAKDTAISYAGASYIAADDFTSSSVFSDFVITNWQEWAAETSYLKDQVVRYNGVKYSVTTNFTSGIFFSADNLAIVYENNIYRIFDIAEYKGGYFDDAANRVWGYYFPTSGMPGRDLSQVMTGITYPGVSVTGQYFDQTSGFDFGLYEQITYDTRTFDENGLEEIYGSQALDSRYYSLYTDTQLGLRAEDIITDGAAYIDENASHAPEEFVPGHVFDSLDIRVKTLSNLNIQGSPEIVVVASYAEDFTTRFYFDPKITGTALPKGYIENIFVINDFNGPQFEGVNYDVNYQDQYIEFYIPPSIPSSVFIYLTGNSGQGEFANDEFIANGQQTEFEITDFKLDKVMQCYVKIDNEPNFDYSLLSPENVQEWLPGALYYADDYVNYNNFVYRVTADFQSPNTFNLENLIAADRIIIRFDTAPPNGSRVQIHLYDFALLNQAYSHIVTTSYTVPENYVSGAFGCVVNLDEPIGYILPYEANILVTLNGTALEPSDQAYYVSNGTTRTYSLPTFRKIDDVDLIVDDDIKVVVDGAYKANVIDYEINRNGVDIPTITFVQAPKDKAKIIISNRYNCKYIVLNEGQVALKSSVTVKTGDVVTVKVYTNHDQFDYAVQCFSGSTSVESSQFLGFEDIGFDLQGFENEKTNIIQAPRYTLTRPVNNFSNLEVYLNGIILQLYYEYVFPTPITLRLNPGLNITSNDVIWIRHVSEETKQSNIEFRIFKGITETYEYIGISKNTSTKLTRDLNIEDQYVYVEDTTVLSQPDPNNNKPGVIFVDGERITFYNIDLINNRLGQIRRATNGTGAPKVHLSGLVVTDAGTNVEIPNARDQYLPAGVTTTVTKTGVNASINEYILNVTDASNLYIGMKVINNSVPADAKIVSIILTDTEENIWQIRINRKTTSNIVDDTVQFSGLVLDSSTLLVGSTGGTISVPAGQLIRTGRIWYDQSTGSAANGLGLFAANTQQVQFLKAL